MAAKYPKEVESPNTRSVPIIELEKALGQITQEVEREKRKLKSTFQKLHQMLVEREDELMAELDAIPADILVKVGKRRESLEKLAQEKEDTEKKLQTNEMNDFLEQQLSGIQNQIEKILGEQILFPRVSLSCHMKNIQKILEDNCHITKTPNPYIFRTLPLWNEGKGDNLLSQFSEAICIDRKNQLIYAGDSEIFSYCKIQIFNFEDEHHLTLLNEEIKYIDSIQTYGDYIYVSSWCFLYKLNKKGDIVKSLQSQSSKITSLFIDDNKLYTSSFKSLKIIVYDLKLENSRSITLQPISFDKDTVQGDIIIINQQIFVLFSYSTLSKYHHPDPIQIFQLDGTLIRSLVTETNIKSARWFCADSYGNILVSDYGGDCIRIFSPEGILMQSIGGDGVIESPRGISIDLKGRIIILNDKGGAKLQAF